MFIGNPLITKYFADVIESGDIGHAYCFAGVDGLGKKTLALSVASQLLKVPVEKLPTHPDFFLMTRGENEKDGKMNRDIAVDQARAIRRQLGNKSWLGGWQIMLVEEGERLNESSTNAFLKTLEEPGERTVIFIVTTDESKILPTVLSRCQVWRFSPAADSIIQAMLQSSGADAATALLATKWAWGRPGRAITLLNDPDSLREMEAESVRFEKIKKLPVHDRLEEMAGDTSDKKDSVKMRELLLKKLDIWLATERKTLLGLSVPGGDKEAKIINLINQAKRQLQTNASPKLIIEQMLLNI